jgi:uncharacterized protein (DUF58 family)
MIDLKEVEKIAKRFELSVFKRSQENSVGLFKSKQRGSGLQFKEHQVYSHGDDVRFIDWNLSARSNQTYIKTFEEEKNIDIHIFVELSLFSTLAFKGKDKATAMLELASLIYLMARSNHDQVSLHISWDKFYSFPANVGMEGVLTLVNWINNKNTTNQRDSYFEPSLFTQEIKKKLAKKKQVIVFSDLASIKENKEFLKIINFPNLFIYQILSPIEVLKKVPFSLWTFSQKKSFTKLNSQSREIENIHPKIKTLMIDENYLENFAKEIRRK